MLSRMWIFWNFHILLVGMLNGMATLENILSVSYKVKYLLTVWYSNLTPSYQREMKTYNHKNIGTHMFTAALFIITPNWKQLRYPTTGQGISKLWYLSTKD